MGCNKLCCAFLNKAVVEMADVDSLLLLLKVQVGFRFAMVVDAGSLPVFSAFSGESGMVARLWPETRQSTLIYG